MIEILILRAVHILGGIFWVGSAVFTTLFLIPALATAGPTAGQIMTGMRQRGLMTVLPAVAVLTILSGLRLMWITSRGFSAVYFSTTSGMTFATAGAAATVAFLIAMLVSRPAGIRMGELGSAMASASPEQRAALTTELVALRRRNTVASNVVMVLLILGAFGMAIARYLG
jgi:uncharacterized membrane protein